ncbi:ABC transporter substrate-binding protein [Vibrio sp. SS-MA-C1-2]|uniref:ABC transporter substrate-binding protein n=1 Tax=Vibrio sp. SS-MA-C1-2 TaxID=2908646 RepID=UPI001F182F1F|nr:ABC transporter substrate-binding protein [Vibrio sp. SS-MA-C1-2]UJF17799.1 ABC transporter substrate-binding protein [Vibrio sp. SS-MA-C1-2]
MMNSNKWVKKSIVLGLALSTIAINTATAKTPASTLVVAKNIDDLVSLDPAQIYEFTGGELANNIYDQLVEYTAKDSETLVSSIASSWTVDPKTHSITFHLDQGATFASGNDVTADDVIYSFHRVLQLNKTPAYVIKQLGWTSENFDSKVKKVDDDTLQVFYKEGTSPDFTLNALTATAASIVDSQEVKRHDKNGDYGNAWLNKHSAGSGPFALRIWKPNNTVVLTQNKNWWEGEQVLKQVVYRHIAEPTTQRIMLEKGDIDIARGLGPDQIQAIKENRDIQVNTYPQAAVYFFSFNVKNEKFNDPKLWKAVKYLIDYQGMTDSFLKDQFKVHQAFWPSGMPGALNENLYSLDVEKAKAILKEANQEGLTLSMDYINGEPFNSMAQSIQATFAQAGIQLNLVPGTGNQVITKYRARTHESILLYWAPDFIDPHSNAKSFAYNADNNDSAYVSTTTWRNGWQDTALNAKVEAALQESNRETRLAMYRDLQKEVMDNSPFSIMFQNQEQSALRNNVQGYEQGTNNHQIYYHNVSK